MQSKINQCDDFRLCNHYETDCKNKYCSGYGKLIRIEPIGSKITYVDCLKYWLELYHK